MKCIHNYPQTVKEILKNGRWMIDAGYKIQMVNMILQ